MFKKFSAGFVGLGVFGMGIYMVGQLASTKKQLEKLKQSNIDDTLNQQSSPSSSSTNDCSDSSCHHHHSPPLLKDDTKRIYDSISNSYDDKVGFDEWLIGVDRLRRKLMCHASGNVLEIAAGSGRNLPEYEKRRENIESLVLSDYSAGMLRNAKAKFEKDFTRKDIVSYKVVDAHNLPFEDDRFDTTIDTYGLCSFEDPIKALREMNRVTKPGGKILLLEHGKSNKYKWLTDYLDAWSVDRAKKWGCWWNRDIEKIVQDSGLSIVKKEVFQLGTCYYYIAQKKVSQN